MSAAFVAGVVMTLAAIVLTAWVWWLSGRHPWSSEGVPLWLVRQAGAAFAFSATLAVLEVGLRAAAAGRGIVAEVVASPVALARGLLVYTWLFGLVAGVCYAARAHLRLRAEALLSAKAEAAASRARLQALRAQLNPHFIFNALHSVAALVRESPSAAEEAVERLGEMLRYALDDGADEEVLLSEEWAFTESYLALEALRYGERLRLQTSVSPEALSCVVPAFVLQPLVENAVRHGVAPRLAGGRLLVQAAVTGTELEIEVRDDGPGVLKPEDTRRRGVGLRAVEERLRSRHAGRARIEVTTAPGSGFVVKLRLPAQVRILEATA